MFCSTFLFLGCVCSCVIKHVGKGKLLIMNHPALVGWNDHYEPSLAVRFKALRGGPPFWLIPKTPVDLFVTLQFHVSLLWGTLEEWN